MGGDTVRTGVGAARHTVRFSPDAGDQAAAAAAFLAAALVRDGAAVALVSPDRWAAIEPCLGRAGVDVAAATRRGDLVLYDPDRMLGAVTVDGRADAAAFEREVGAAVRAVATGGRATHVYGEMVDLLWRRGRVLGVLELEALWEELVGEGGVSVLCGYAADASGDPGDPVRRVCEAHGKVTGPGAPAAFATLPVLEASATFGALPEAPRAARRWVVDALRSWPSGGGGLVDDAALVVTELAANAVYHTASAFTVRVEASRDVVRIVVEDGDAETEAVAPRHHPALSTSGRGLQIVAGLVSRWGVDPAPGGKSVWAELAVAAPR